MNHLADELSFFESLTVAVFKLIAFLLKLAVGLSWLLLSLLLTFFFIRPASTVPFFAESTLTLLLVTAGGTAVQIALEEFIESLGEQPLSLSSKGFLKRKYIETDHSR